MNRSGEQTVTIYFEGYGDSSQGYHSVMRGWGITQKVKGVSISDWIKQSGTTIVVCVGGGKTQRIV